MSLNKKIKILHLEDSLNDAGLVARELKKGNIDSDILVVDKRDEFENALRDFSPDIILSDHSLVAFDSIEALKIVNNAGINVPFILVTATMSDEHAAMIMRDGASDYILKDRLNRLPEAVKNAIEKSVLAREQKKSEERYRQIVETSGEGIWVIDENYKTVFVNKRFTEIFGYSYEEMMGKTNFDLMDEEGKIATKKRLAERKKGKPEIYEHIFFTKNGKKIWVNVAASSIKDDEGNYKGALGMLTDITDKKTAEEQLKRSEAFNVGVINSLSAHIAVVNQEGTIISVNDAWKQFAIKNSNTHIQGMGNGINYFDVCKKATENGDSLASEALKGMKSVMDGSIPFFYLEYPCHSPETLRWFGMRVVKFKSDELLIVVAHENITNVKIAEQELEKTLAELEQRVELRTTELSTTNRALKDEVLERILISSKLEEKNKEITDSIIYAQRLQKAILPNSKMLLQHFPDSFIFNRAKDFVSGDFYWFHKSQQKLLIACADSTGHGVPGAFMSILGADLLGRILTEQEWEFPSNVLELMDAGIANALKGDENELIMDGMDMAVCIVDKAAKTIQFSGAINSIVIVSAGKAHEYKGSRYGLGKYIDSKAKRFETIDIPYSVGDMLYMYSDGFRDQFGGPKNKKFMFPRQLELFEQVAHLSEAFQEKIIIKTFDDWKGNYEQVDDVLVMGIRL